MSIIDQYIENCKHMHEELEADLSHLQTALAVRERALVDMYHAIETSNYNAAEGFWAYKRLQRILRELRVLREERRKKEILFKNLQPADMIGKLEKMQKQMQNVTGKRDWSLDMREIIPEAQKKGAGK
jgi:hypothetical protein